jgi:hypothetical protein
MMFGSSLPPIVLFTLFVYSDVQHILCSVFVLDFAVLCTLCFQFLWIINFWLSLRYSLTFILYMNITHLTKVQNIALWPHWHLSVCQMVETNFIIINMETTFHNFNFSAKISLSSCTLVYFTNFISNHFSQKSIRATKR